MTEDRLWLEEIEGKRALSWVEEQNKRSVAVLGEDEQYERDLARVLENLESKDRIPYGNLRNKEVNGFWVDADHVRGLVRTLDLADYGEECAEWNVLIDVDALAEEEGENWVYSGTRTLTEEELSLVMLSRGGKDAVVIREFDRRNKQFVENGFFVEEDKSMAAWLDRDTILICTAQDGGRNTDAGYPGSIRLWRRGQKLQEAQVLLECESDDMRCFVYLMHREDGKVNLLGVSHSFYLTTHYHYTSSGIRKLPLPADVIVQDTYRGMLVLELRSEWRGIPGGSAVLYDLERDTAVSFFTPEAHQSLRSVCVSRDSIYLNIIDNVRQGLLRVLQNNDAYTYERITIEGAECVSLFSCDMYSEELLISATGYLTPQALYHMNAQGELRLCYSNREAFDRDGLHVQQHVAISPDGTRIPYTQISRKYLPLDGNTPTLLYGYGGFEISLLPHYDPTVGSLWLERGGCYVIANIRGGGEFGPEWHQAALKENRQKSFDDFYAVALDLQRRGVCNSKTLGIEGGSNGGLLVGACMTQHPESFGAVVCQVPLLDMLRYHKLLAGASWMGEYGNPDLPEERAAIEAYSPYHRLDAEAEYPPILLMTSTRDDRVHPGHARRMAHKMSEQGHDVLYYENTEGGHGMAANMKQRARMSVQIFRFLWKKLAV